MKNKILTIAIATLVSGAAFATGGSSTDTSSVATASVSTGSLIITNGEGFAFSNQFAGANATNTSVAGTSGSNGWTSSNATAGTHSEGSSSVLVSSQTGAVGNAFVLGGASADAYQAGSAEAEKTTYSWTGYSKVESDSAVASGASADVVNNGIAGGTHYTSASNLSTASQNPYTTNASSIGSTTNIGGSFDLGYSDADTFGIVGETGYAKAKLW